MAHVDVAERPVLHDECCKGCRRCLEACAHGCLAPGDEIHPLSGLVPVVLSLDACNGCGLCVEACPEPYGLEMAPAGGPAAPGRRSPPPERARDVPDERFPLPRGRPLVVKGTHASAIGALLAGCRHFYGYPITPSTEGAELMAKLLPALGGSFLQAPSEVATVNMMYGAGGAGRRTMTYTSSPGFSLMLEGVSYLVGAELPAVFVNVMRAGPGLGNIAPEQSDLKLACRGLGHGTTHAIVLAPATPQEMLDFTMLAFELAFSYRNPVIVAADAHLGQMTGRVDLPAALVKPGLPGWAVCGDAAHRANVHASICLCEHDQEAHVLHLLDKYARMTEAEQRAELLRCEDAETLVVACGTPARMAAGAVSALRAEGVAVGLFRPQTVWPFPLKPLLPLLERARRIVVVEASEGQLEDELRLALAHAGAGAGVAIAHVRRHGGVLPSQREIAEAVRAAARQVTA
ncbi:3-methyl-2-oxobutanoate dehydrogenase subunit VorB [Anaeromyxobacter sp. Fw109-5]|uniref:3-methyl-2-oxobutanoate dehydrogenase subunit VorB n=1 Tax=Anaeromyxobacter sp. (strain Fw109-5) TaxID=404589 RepID=UPI000158A889|nr:3-methyl-2-oxobutanoate dehydrogenase subunit VorB [Anaeromyxobacter sp. Fw109-5]ABS28292.1 pyruvate flavodoxin/ferredoxin oxidoreductase domain protein [Anaeromyxobacter sp. Fw109-5]